jgi:hypothetical protein
MDRDPRLLAALDFILNDAGEAEIEVLLKAIERRSSDMARLGGLGGYSPASIAKKTSEAIGEQFGMSMDAIRGTVRGFVTDMILKEVPGIPEADLKALLEAYVPDPGAGPKEKADVINADGVTSGGVPPDVILAMVRLFMEYSTGAMPPSRQAELWNQTPGWYDTYWEAFPDPVRQLITACLKGKITPEVFWTALFSALGL